MKIKLLKDIPGYKAGEEQFVDDINTCIRCKQGGCFDVTLKASWLISEGYAEEIKDDIDIEAIRASVYCNVVSMDARPMYISQEQRRWFDSLIIIKKVIDQLNTTEKYGTGSWTLGWFSEGNNAKLSVRDRTSKMHQYTLLDYCSSKEVGEKVIELCEPELKVLFGVK